MTLQMVTFAYQGVELIGVTAGEADNPGVVLPKATNGITYRILIFYIGALVVIMSLVPWDQLSPDASPFVYLFDKIGLPAAADVINLVVITAATSSCNSGLFSTGRMLYSLAQRRQAPARLGVLSSTHVPAAGIHVSAAVMLIGVVVNYLVPKKAFDIVTSVSLVGTLWTWGIIMVAHYRYRLAASAGKVRAAPFRMPWAPFANWLVLAFLLLVAVMLAFDDDNRVALYVAPVWFGGLAIAYRLCKPEAQAQTA
jgi:AAT family amino acid transporter